MRGNIQTSHINRFCGDLYSGCLKSCCLQHVYVWSSICCPNWDCEILTSEGSCKKATEALLVNDQEMSVNPYGLTLCYNCSICIGSSTTKYTKMYLIRNDVKAQNGGR